VFSSNVPFARLRALLLDLGFTERVVDENYLGFYHAPSDCLFTFRMYRPQQKVSNADVLGVRSQLDWRGLLSEGEFDAALGKVSA
jgi:hypothetical protein